MFCRRRIKLTTHSKIFRKIRFYSSSNHSNNNQSSSSSSSEHYNRSSNNQVRITKLWNQDLYQLLGLRKSATKDQIKSAFVQKIKILHPDVNIDQNQNQNQNHKESDSSKRRLDQFIEVRQAYEVLYDDNQRKLYDQHFTKLQNPFIHNKQSSTHNNNKQSSSSTTNRSTTNNKNNNNNKRIPMKVTNDYKFYRNIAIVSGSFCLIVCCLEAQQFL